MLRRGYLSPTCAECGRTFDLLNPSDAEEWAYGHDCEVPEPCGYCGGSGTVAAMTPIGEVWPKPCPQCAGEPLADRLNTVHCIMQELQAAEVELPMRDYAYVYAALECAREALADDDSPHKAPEACAECNGAGYVPAIGAEDEQADGYVPCDACDGEGER